MELSLTGPRDTDTYRRVQVVCSMSGRQRRTFRHFVENILPSWSAIVQAVA